ncbi:MAG: LUD domain-containing protein, partial [Desulfovibrionaceae bacterium]
SLGLKVWETDLGEFIVQLGGEMPSHILAPAVHLSREQISKLFADKLGQTSESPEELTHMAREVLREQFLNADVCITGANQVVAETGTVVLFENEGNIRMGTTCARTHIAVMSLEKVAETWEDAAAVMQMLPRSATGQGLSTYVSAITGARREGERDGARDFHLVILDNGRSRLMADPVLREALCCVRCGSCLNVCPVYQTVGGFTYGWVYSGPIGQLLTPLIGPEGRGDDLPFACTLCGACAETCPVGIDHPKLFLELRRQLSEGERDRAPAVERLALGAHTALALHPGLYRAAVGTMRALNPGLGLAERCIPAIARFARRRCLPRLRRPFRARYKGPGSGSSNAQGGGHE